MSAPSPLSSCCATVNVGPRERVVCGLLSGWLLSRALRGEQEILSLVAAGALAFRALSGHCVGYAALDVDTSAEK